MKAYKVAILGTAVLFGAASCGDSTGPEGEVPTLTPADPAAVLFLDQFENENNGKGVLDWTNFQQWNVTEGCVDLHGNGFYDVQPGKGLYVDLDGTCQAAGTIETKNAIELQPGNYIVEFWLAGNNRIARSDTVDVTLGSVYSERFVLRRDDRFTLYMRPVTVTTATTAKLRFKNHGGDNQGALLDLARVRRVQ